jgi:hypothetical protein
LVFIHLCPHQCLVFFQLYETTFFPRQRTHFIFPSVISNCLPSVTPYSPLWPLLTIF